MMFTCVIFHLFFHSVNFLSHATHFSRHHIYAFASILGCLVQSPNGITLLVNDPNEATTIAINVWRAVANFWNVNLQPIIFVKTSNDFIFLSAKGLHWNLCFYKNTNNVLMKGMIGCILVLTKSFILNDTNICFMKYQKRSIKNLNKLCFVCTVFFGKK